MLLKSRAGRGASCHRCARGDRDRGGDARGLSVADAQDSDTAAERSAREIQAARDRANAAAQAMFDAESRVDQLAVEIESTNAELAALEAEVAAFRSDLEEMAVRKFVSSGVGQNPLLAGVEGANDAAAADVLFAVATDSSAVTLDEFEEVGRQLDETRGAARGPTAARPRTPPRSTTELRRRAEEEIVCSRRSRSSACTTWPCRRRSPSSGASESARSRPKPRPRARRRSPRRRRARPPATRRRRWSNRAPDPAGAAPAGDRTSAPG